MLTVGREVASSLACSTRFSGTNNSLTRPAAVCGMMPCEREKEVSYTLTESLGQDIADITKPQDTVRESRTWVIRKPEDSSKKYINIKK